MPTKKTDQTVTPPPPKPEKIPALFATIHFRSERRPDGYTDEEIAELNEKLNKPDAD